MKQNETGVKSRKLNVSEAVSVSEDDDDVFVYCPSCLQEGKSLGTAKETDLVSVDDLSGPKTVAAFAQLRRSGGKVGRVKLKRVQVRTEQVLKRAILRFSRGKFTEKEFKKFMQNEMRKSWRDVFMAGTRATAVKEVITPQEEKWLKGAMKHEMGFLNGFINAVVEDTWTMPLPRRIKMYIDTLSGFYESARVLGLPSNIIISWLGPRDKVTCVGCQYMFEHSPYTKFLLPTTPRSGLTPCLANCRDRLMIRIATPDEIADVEDDHKFTRRRHVENLRKLKRDGHL